MADGLEHLNAVMELLPEAVSLSIIDGADGPACAWWSGDGQFDVYNSIAIGFDMYMCLSIDAKDLHVFSISCKHVMGAMSGDTINIDDTMCDMIVNEVYKMIDSGALLHDA